MHVKKPGAAVEASAPPPAAPAPNPQADVTPTPKPAAPPPPPPPPPPPVAEAPKPAPTPVKAEVMPEPAKSQALTVPAEPKQGVIVAPADLPDYLKDMVYTGDGVTPGFENVGATGLQLPMLRIAQPTTPAVTANKLRAGDIYRHDDPEKAIIPQGSSFDFSIGFHYMEFIEWAERESGLGILNRSKNPSGDLARRSAKAFANRGGPKEVRQIGDKNVKIDVYQYHVFFVVGEDDREINAIPMSRTMFKKGNTLVNLARKRIGCPIFIGRYEASTVLEKNAKGMWYNWQFKTNGWVKPENREFMEKCYTEAKAMYDNLALNFAAEDAALPEDTVPAAGSEGSPADF